MASSSHNKRINVPDDRISSLPDDLIHKILSFIGIKHAVQTSALSSRWKIIWTSMPYLNFSTEDFRTLSKFSKFVTHVLSKRNNEIDVSSVELIFRGKVSQFVKRILDYAFCHNVQQLAVRCVLDRKNIDFPLSLLKSQSLKHLTMVGSNWRFIDATSSWELPSLTSLHLEYIIFCDKIADIFFKCVNLTNLTLKCCRMERLSDVASPKLHIIPMSALELPALRTLHLYSITLCDDNTDKGMNLFSKCADLKNLTLYWFQIMGSNCVKICHPTVSNLTLEIPVIGVKAVKVVAPQLESLSIKDTTAEFVISAPKLNSFFYKGSNPLHLSSNAFRSLEKADICVSTPQNADAHQIVYLLQLLRSVKFLSLNSDIVKILSSSMELISHQPSPFANLKRLKIYPDSISLLMHPNEKVITMSTEVKNYFLNSSPTATFTMVSNEEITTLENAKLARKLMGRLQVVLEECEQDMDTNPTYLDKGKTSMESHKAKMNEQGNSPPETNVQCHFGGRMTQIDRYWEDLNKQLLQGQKKTSRIISLSTKIEGLMTNVPPLQKANLQAMFSSLCEEADVTMMKVTEFTKIQLIKTKAL